MEKLNQQKKWCPLSGVRSFQFSDSRKIAVDHYGKWEKWPYLPKTLPRAKLLITDPAKVWVSGFLSVNRNGKLLSTIMENWKNGHCHPKNVS